MRFVALIGLFCCLAIVAQTRAADPTPEANAATVNGEAITLAELDAAVNAHLPNVLLTVSQRRQLRTSLLEDLIDDTLLRQFFAKQAVKADPIEIEAQSKALAAQLAKENRTLAAYLKETGQTETQLRTMWSLQSQLAAFVKQVATDDILKAYHAANRDHFDRVEVRASHVMLRIPKFALPMERTAAKEKLQAVRAELLAGKIDFATAARKFSQCTTAKSGGDLGFVPRRGLPDDEPLAKVAFAMKVGEISDIIETTYGYHLLAVTDRKPGTPSVLEQCKVEVLETYTDDYRVELLKKLRKDAQIKITLP